MLTIMKGRWYARPMVAGRRFLYALDVPVRGVRPASLRSLGNAEFEASRAEALRAAESKMAQVRDARWHARMADMLRPEGGRKGRKKERLTFDGLYAAWRKAPHTRARCPQYEKHVARVLERLAKWAKARGISEVEDFEPKHALLWKERLMADGCRGRNLNQHLSMARSVIRHVRHVAGLSVNPFDGLAGVQEAMIHRRPLSDDELAAVLRKAHGVVRDLILCGACTAMRLGDCCRLRWADVDLAAGFITVKTHKSGARVEIPILPDLAAALKKARPGAGGAYEAYVWPALAEDYARANQNISRLVGRVFERAHVECRAERSGGGRRANVAGFHALRTTWITKALSAGVPTELVRRVSGHAGVEVVLKHYFQPGRDELKKAILQAFAPPEKKDEKDA